MNKFIKVLLIFSTILVFIIVAFVVFLFVIRSSNPLRRTESQIRESILEITPIGMSSDEILQIIKDNADWELYGGISTIGFPSDESWNTLIGETSIRATIGHYRHFFTTAVVVFWGFDEYSNLIDIRVRKDVLFI